MSQANFTCYLGNGEFDYLALPLEDGHHPMEMGTAIDHFIRKYGERYWRLYTTGTEGGEPLYTYDPSRVESFETERGNALLEILFGA